MKLSRTRLIFILCIVVSISLYPYYALAAESIDDKEVIAQVNDESITTSEFIYYISKYSDNIAELNAQGESGKRKLLDKIIEFKLLLAVAKEYKGDKEPIFIMKYKDFLRKRYAELFKKNLVNYVKVTQDDIQIEFLNLDKSGKRKSKEEIKKEKQKINDDLHVKKFKELLQNKLDELKKENSIKIHDDVIQQLEEAKDVGKDAIVFEVATEAFTLERLYTLIPPNVRHSPKSMLLTKKFLSIVIDDEIDTTLLAREARRLELDKNEVFFNLGNEDYYEKALVNSLDYNHEFLKKTYGGIKITDEEVRQYYDEKKQDIIENGNIYKVRLLFFMRRDDADDAHSELEKGNKFEKVVENYKDKLKNKNCELGYVSKKKIEQEYGSKLKEELFDLDVGEVSEVIALPDGYIIAEIVAKKENVIAKFDDIAPKVKDIVKDEKNRQALAGLVSDLKKKAKIQINNELLQSITWND